MHVSPSTGYTDVDIDLTFDYLHIIPAPFLTIEGAIGSRAKMEPINGLFISIVRVVTY
jgi:hypothetical protein